MKINEPSAGDITNLLVEGETYKVNGRKYKFTQIRPCGSACITGMRGGWANIVPSTQGTRVQVTTLHSRDWVRTIEAV
jgi:hypothetical protein